MENFETSDIETTSETDGSEYEPSPEAQEQDTQELSDPEGTEDVDTGPDDDLDDSITEDTEDIPAQPEEDPTLEEPPVPENEELEEPPAPENEETEEPTNPENEETEEPTDPENQELEEPTDPENQEQPEKENDETESNELSEPEDNEDDLDAQKEDPEDPDSKELAESEDPTTDDELNEGEKDPDEPLEPEDHDEGLSDEEKDQLKAETGWSDDIIDSIRSPEEAEIYKNADLHEEEVNGKKCLVRNDVDMDQVDEFGDTNRERMADGSPPLTKSGEKVELHHIGQKQDSPFAELTMQEHRGKGNDTILHDKQKATEIDRSAFAKERSSHWEARSGQ